MNAVGSPLDVILEDQSGLVGGNRERCCFTLRRTGLKALRFSGRQLVDAVGLRDGREISHDLSIYETLDQRIVVELITRRYSADPQDLYQVEAFNSLAEAAGWLQSYDAANYVPIPPDLVAAKIPLPWAVMQAVHLRQTMDRICIDYRSLLTEVFTALDLTDPVDGVLVSPKAEFPSREPV